MPGKDPHTAGLTACWLVLGTMATTYGKVGVEGTASTVVEQTKTAKTMNGKPERFYTPSLVAWKKPLATLARS